MTDKPTPSYSLKDMLFNKEKVTYLTGVLKAAYSELDETAFVEDVVKKFPELELKERISWIRSCIQKHFPEDYKTTLQLLVDSLEFAEDSDYFVFAAYSDYVQEVGCTAEYIDISLSALGAFTRYCSAEFAIRHFINNFPDETYKQFQMWAVSKNHHQRRLASEGLRPKLPWAIGITFDYKRGADILDHLFFDTERYVTRSVANHLNDISKIDPDYVVEKLRTWKASGKQNEKEMTYIINHSLRTSIKRGHVKTFHFLGYSDTPDISVKNLTVQTPTVKLNERLAFSFDITAHAPESLIIDYRVTYPTPGKRVSEKVFKIKKVKMKEGETMRIEKKHLFKKMTTKKLYSGEHILAVQVNGSTIESTTFYLYV